MLGKKSTQCVCAIAEMYFSVILKVMSEKMVVTGLPSSLPSSPSFKFQVPFFVQLCFFFFFLPETEILFIYSLGDSMSLHDYFASVGNTVFGSVILYSECINTQRLNIPNQTQMLQVEHSSTSYAAQSSNSLMSASIISSYYISLFTPTCSLEDTASSAGPLSK